ncbi:hypothetical protein FOCC_FOCC001964 [Frankliniella occidentalis]|nr:hypothetical protein FOCC_FOCC001964 [Frankliniella occidentalis]
MPATSFNTALALPAPPTNCSSLVNMEDNRKRKSVVANTGEEPPARRPRHELNVPLQANGHAQVACSPQSPFVQGVEKCNLQVSPSSSLVGPSAMWYPSLLPAWCQWRGFHIGTLGATGGARGDVSVLRHYLTFGDNEGCFRVEVSISDTLLDGTPKASKKKLILCKNYQQADGLKQQSPSVKTPRMDKNFNVTKKSWFCESPPALRIYYDLPVAPQQAQGSKVLGYITCNLKHIAAARPGGESNREGRAVRLLNVTVISE